MLKYTVSVLNAKRKKKRAEALFYLYPELVGLHFLLSTLGLNTLAFWNLHYIKILLVNKQKNKSMLALILNNFCSN